MTDTQLSVTNKDTHTHTHRVAAALRLVQRRYNASETGSHTSGSTHVRYCKVSRRRTCNVDFQKCDVIYSRIITTKSPIILHDSLQRESHKHYGPHTSVT